jgi:hypothetical protein
VRHFVLINLTKTFGNYIVGREGGGGYFKSLGARHFVLTKPGFCSVVQAKTKK